MEDMAKESTHQLLPTTTTTFIQRKDNKRLPINNNSNIAANFNRRSIKAHEQIRIKKMKSINDNIIYVVDEPKEEGEDFSSNSSSCDEKEEVERKIKALQRIVPGGESLGVDKLFEETAGYIMALQSQLKAMKALATFFESLDKEKRMFGG